MNDAGQVVGWRGDGSGFKHGFIWTPPSAPRKDTDLRRLALILALLFAAALSAAAQGTYTQFDAPGSTGKRDARNVQSDYYFR